MNVLYFLCLKVIMLCGIIDLYNFFFQNGKYCTLGCFGQIMPHASRGDGWQVMRVIAFYFNTSKNFTYTSRHDSVSIYVNLRYLRHFKIHMLMHIQYGCCRRVTDAHKVLAARWRANQILGQYLYKDAP